MQKSLSAMGVGLLGMGSIVVPSSATATTPECGTSTASMAISFTSGICQAEFSGNGSFTVPNVASGLAAILVGAGGGSYVDGATGYAGSGGEVNYYDLSSAPAGTALGVIVGLGGSTSAVWDNPSSKGGDTSVTRDLAPTLVEGGAPGGSYSMCNLAGIEAVYIGEGQGAGGNPVIGASPGYECSGGGPGITPSESDQDNAGNSVAEVFTNFSVELGKGGFMAKAASFPNALVQGPGQGASVKWNSGTSEIAGTSALPNRSGSDGLVVFRWYPTERILPAATGQSSPKATAQNSLAVTGQNSIQTLATSTLSLLMVSLGLALLSISNRMRRRSN